MNIKSLNKTCSKEKQLVERQVLKELPQNGSDKRNAVRLIVDYNVWLAIRKRKKGVDSIPFVETSTVGKVVKQRWNRSCCVAFKASFAQSIVIGVGRIFESVCGQNMHHSEHTRACSHEIEKAGTTPTRPRKDVQTCVLSRQHDLLNDPSALPVRQCPEQLVLLAPQIFR